MGQQLFATDNPSVESTTEACYVVLVIGQLRLVVLQPQIYALEPAIDVKPLDKSTDRPVFVPEDSDNQKIVSDSIVGYVAVDGIKYPVYCLSETLDILLEFPASRRICVLFHIASGLFGFLCDQVILVEWTKELEIRPLPACMCTANNKLQGLILQGEEVYCMVLADDLLAYCTSQISPREKP